MKVYREHQLWNWHQAILNGIIRPNRFFKTNLWEGSPFLSVPLVLFWTGLSTYISSYGSETFSLASCIRSSLFQVLLFFVAGLMVELAKKPFRLEVSPAKLSSFLSYIMMTYTFIIFVCSYLFVWNELASVIFAAWSAYGFAESFVGYRPRSIFSYGARLAGGLLLVAPALHLHSYMINLQIENSKILAQFRKEQKVSKHTLKLAKQYKEEYATSPRKYDAIIRQGDLRVGDHFSYKVSFWRGKQRIHGYLDVSVNQVQKNGYVLVTVNSKFGKNKRRFDKTLSPHELTAAQSMLNKNQKPGHFVAFALLTTAHMSLDRLPKYEQMGIQKFLRNIKTRRTSNAGVSGYQVEGLPNIVYLSSELHEQTSVSVSRRIGLPLAVAGKMPDTNVRYKIELNKFKKGRL